MKPLMSGDAIRLINPMWRYSGAVLRTLHLYKMLASLAPV